MQPGDVPGDLRVDRPARAPPPASRRDAARRRARALRRLVPRLPRRRRRHASGAMVKSRPSHARRSRRHARRRPSHMILVTGGAGFIGANFVLDWLAAARRAGRQPRQAHLRRQPRQPRAAATATRAMCSSAATSATRRSSARCLRKHRPRAIVNFAAESHVDRSIHGPAAFIETNVVGTFQLLEAVRAHLVGACRTRSARRSASCTFRPTRSTARSARRSGVHRNHAVRAEQPVFGVEGGVRPSGARVASHLRAADRHDATARTTTARGSFPKS